MSKQISKGNPQVNTNKEDVYKVISISSGGIGTNDINKKLRLNTDTIRRIAKELEEEELIISIKENNRFRYLPTKRD